MAEKINATCSICGKGYYKCLSCISEINAMPWKHYTDTAEHYKVHQVIHGFNTGVYTKEEAREKLSKIDLSDVDSFLDNIKKTIENIMKENKKTVNNAIEMISYDEVDEKASYMNRKKRHSNITEVKVDAKSEEDIVVE